MGSKGTRPRAGALTAAVGFALIATVAICATSRAQDAGLNSGSDWYEVEQVLVLPSVYGQSAAANKAAASSAQPADPSASAQDCNPDAASADGPADSTASTNDSSAAQNCTAAASADSSTVEASADGGGQTDNGLSSQLGSSQEYQDQQAAAEELGSAGVTQMPPTVILGPPVIAYSVPRAYTPRVRSYPVTRPAWMPAPMPRLAPLPPLVVHGLPVMPRAAGFRGMTGFRGR